MTTASPGRPVTDARMGPVWGRMCRWDRMVGWDRSDRRARLGYWRAAPVADRLLDSRDAVWRLRVAGAGPAVASNAARGAAARPPACWTRGKPSPSVCVDTSRDSGGGDQSPA
jgi:hypothetical protein